ncbi:MAG TPA: YihY/virulence factor BrkB family protein [Magnetospirillaceae bacterium]|jgi:membrane protein
MNQQPPIIFEAPKAGWRHVLVCTWKQMRRDNLSGLAAGAAYYALLSLFPFLGALVSIYGLIADPISIQQDVDRLYGILPDEAISLVSSWLHTLTQNPPRKFGIGLIVSVLAAAWSLWSATSTVMAAINICYRQEDHRGFIRFGLHALGLSMGLAVFGAIGLALVTIPPLLPGYFPEIKQWSNLVSLARWPALAVFAFAALAILYRYAPAQSPKTWNWISWGATAATGLWLIGSVAFSSYVALIGSYDRTYGSVGAIIVLLAWLYLSAYAVLIGAELNAELERLAEAA